MSGEYLHYSAFGRSSLLENRTEYHVGGLESSVAESSLGYKHEMLHGEYESSE